MFALHCTLVITLQYSADSVEVMDPDFSGRRSFRLVDWALVHSVSRFSNSVRVVVVVVVVHCSSSRPSSRTYRLTWHKLGLNTVASRTQYTNYKEKN